MASACKSTRSRRTRERCVRTLALLRADFAPVGDVESTNLRATALGADHVQPLDQYDDAGAAKHLIHKLEALINTMLGKRFVGAKLCIWPVVLAPAVLYVFLTRGLWRFPGCPPDSLAYPGHPPPILPIDYSVALIFVIWAWFALWCGTSLFIFARFRGRRQRWVRVLSWIGPVVVSMATPIPCIVFVTMATLC